MCCHIAYFEERRADHYASAFLMLRHRHRHSPSQTIYRSASAFFLEKEAEHIICVDSHLFDFFKVLRQPILHTHHISDGDSFGRK
jgi:hypothetical protein